VSEAELHLVNGVLRDALYSEEWYIECVGWRWHIAKVKKSRYSA